MKFFFCCSVLLFCLLHVSSQNVLYYDIEIKHDKDNLDFIVTISYPTGKKADSIYIFSDNAKINQLFINGNQTVHYIHKNDSVITFSHEPVQNIKFDYSIPISDDNTFSSGALIIRREHAWYPYHQDAIFQSSMKILSDEKYYTISSGKIEKSQDTIIFHTKKTNSLYLIMLPQDSFSCYEIKNPVMTFSFFKQNSDTTSWNGFAQEFVTSYNWFCNYFSYNPLERLNVVEISEDWFQMCQALKGCVLFGKLFYQYYIEDKTCSWIPHEVCHQWWGHSLFIKRAEKKNIRFFEESITEFLKGCYVKAVYGDSVYRKLDTDYQDFFSHYVSADKDIPIDQITTFDTQESGIIIYNKGPLLLKSIDDENLDCQKAIKQFYRQYRNTITSWYDFEQLLPNHIRTVFTEKLHSTGL
jgi:hypothetical protein